MATSYQDEERWDKIAALYAKFDRPSYSANLLKAQKEITEAQQAPKHKRLLEYADAIICIKMAAAADGFSISDLNAAEDYKMIVNLVREWQKQPDGTFQHIE